MNDNQLEKLLKTVKVPKPSKEFESAFPKKIILALRRDAEVVQPKQTSKSTRPSQK